MSPEEPSGGIFERARELLDVAGTRTGQVARIARLELDLLGIDRARRTELAALGERGFELLARGEGSRFEGDPVVMQVVQKIRELDAERNQRRREIEEIRAASRGEGAGGPF